MNDNFKYLTKISHILKINFLILISSLIIYFFWHILEISKLLSFTSIHPSIGHLSYLVLLLTPVFMISNASKIYYTWIFFSIMTLLDLWNMILLSNHQLFNWNTALNSENGHNAFILLYISFFIIVMSIIDFGNKRTISNQDFLAITGSSILFLSLYQFYNHLNKSIPNEERSIFMGGMEIHHIHFGLLLLVLTPLFYKYLILSKKLSNKIIGYIIMGYIYGSVFDESFYYMLTNVTDEAYFDYRITSLSVFIMILCISFWYYCKKRI